MKTFAVRTQIYNALMVVGASFEGLSVVIEGYQRPTMKLLDDMKTLLNDSETVALIVKFSKRLYKHDRLKISI